MNPALHSYIGSTLKNKMTIGSNRRDIKIETKRNFLKKVNFNPDTHMKPVILSKIN